MGHILNLACQAFLFTRDKDAVELAITAAEELRQEEERLGLHSEGEYDQNETTQEEWRKFGALGKIHNVAVWLRRSPCRYQRFVELAGRILPRDNDTRWNSWLTMLEAAIQLENYIRVFIDKNWDDMQKNFIDRDEWECLKETRDILRPFRDTTTILERDNATLDQVLESMDYLIGHIKAKQSEHTADTNLSASLFSMWFAFDKYYKLTDRTPAYAGALLLNPTFRRRYLEDEWKAVEEVYPGTMDRAIDAVRRLWTKEYKFVAIPGESSTPIDPESITNALERHRFEREMARSTSLDEFKQFIEVILIRSCCLQVLLTSFSYRAIPYQVFLALPLIGGSNLPSVRTSHASHAWRSISSLSQRCRPKANAYSPEPGVQ